MMTDDEIIAVVQAHKEGKKIERTVSGSRQGIWMDVTSSPCWNFPAYDYRVAPEDAHLVTGYCFPRDISKIPVCGMIKVKQIHLEKGENPLPEPRKPREWWIAEAGDGRYFRYDKLEPLVEGQVHVREVID